MREEDFDYQTEMEEAKGVRRSRLRGAFKYGSAFLTGFLTAGAAIVGSGFGQNHFLPRVYVLGEREVEGERKIAVEVPFAEYDGHSRLAYIDPRKVPSGVDSFRTPSWNLNYSGLLIPGNTHLLYTSSFGDFDGDNRVDLRLDASDNNRGSKLYNSIDFRGER